MKVFAITAFLALGSLAQAANIFVDCTTSAQSGPAPIANGSVTSTCAGLSLPGGATNISATLFYKYDASFGFGTGQVMMTHDVLGASLNGFDGAAVPTQVVSDTARPFNGSIVVANPSAAILSAIAAGSSITGTWAGATGSTSNVAFSYRWQLDYTPSGTVPEPSTYAMMAAGLMSFYALRRKS